MFFGMRGVVGRNRSINRKRSQVTTRRIFFLYYGSYTDGTGTRTKLELELELKLFQKWN